ncbi:hypothetical protein FisN_18Hu171 [Fistulifera solaris]|uniref:Uncharacterized protein n=1 Tax=Fistulifera solaris TaxID=1519565 RepID=A0A1Z5JV84_FISSO|nr:hypothetical protein FisN_18Hu171 [Fistulifera solaris]|eukprot:GAX17960.1 hypothetical protein FisN_18Hu171 [Fistulifera solaris]
MEGENEGVGALLQIIPPSLLQPTQVARWKEKGVHPTCRLLRNPISLKELVDYNFCYAILQENNTMIYVKPRGFINDFPVIGSRFVYFRFGEDAVHIVGPSDNAIAQTVAFLIKVETSSAEGYCYEIRGHGGTVDFRAAGSRCLAHLLNIASSNKVTFESLLLSSEQSTALAIRRHQLDLLLNQCWFKDGGTAFVDALQNRQGPFGSLCLKGSAPVNAHNMRDLLQVDCINHFGAIHLGKNVVPLSAKADSVFFEEVVTDLNSGGSLNVFTRKLALNLVIDEGERFPTAAVLAFFRRLAQLGHLVELKIAFCDLDASLSMPNAAVHELIRTVMANVNLQVLDLTTDGNALEWKSRQLNKILVGIKDHETLRTLKIDVDNEDIVFGPSFEHLLRLLTHKRNLVVMDDCGEAYTDEDAVDDLYFLNNFYLGSTGMLDEPPAQRSWLVTTALVEGALYDFQLSALLLSNHIDILHELIQIATTDVEVRGHDLPFRDSVRKRQRN